METILYRAAQAFSFPAANWPKVKSRLVLLLMFLTCTAVLALPPTTEERSLIEALVLLLQESPIPQIQPDSPENPFEQRADQLYSKYSEQEDELALPGARIPLSDVEREELYLELRKNPDYLDRLGVYLPRRPEVFDWAAKQYDEDSYLPGWLLVADPGLRAALLKRAAVNGGLYLEALVILDWPAAEPIVNKKLEGKTSEERLAGLAALRQHAPRELEARTALLAILRDDKGEDSDRGEAADLLLGYEWEGRDELFLAMLKDPFWSEHRDPIERFVVSHPGWRQHLVGALEDPGGTVRRNAIIALNAMVSNDPSAETIQPLLPWLEDEAWTDTDLSRNSLIEAAGQTDAPEAVPGLLGVLKTSADEGEMLAAATSLARYRPKGFESAWRAAKPRFLHPGYGEDLAGIGVSQGWVSLDEQVEAVATLLQSPDASYDEAKPFPILLGAACAYGDESSPALRARLADLAQEWQAAGNPALEKLEESLSRHQGAEVDAYFLNRLSHRDITPGLLRELLGRRRTLLANESSTLEALLEKGGARAGVARSILGRKMGTEDELIGDDDQALAWLSASRYLGEKIPLDWLRSSISNPVLREAVLAYLEASEVPESQLLLESLDQGFRISGRKPVAFDFTKLEKALAGRYQGRGATGELYSLATSHDGHTLQRASQEIWVEDGKAELIFRSREMGSLSHLKAHRSYDRRWLSPTERQRFLNFVQERSVNTWGEWVNVTSHHFTTYQYLYLDMDGGRRVAATFNQGTDQGEAGARYEELIDLFEELKEAPAETVYEFTKGLPEAKVIEDHLVSDLLIADGEGLKARLVDRGTHTWRLLAPAGLGEAAKTRPLLPTARHAQGRAGVPLPNGDTLLDGYGRLMRDDGHKETTFLRGDVGLPVIEPSGQRGLLVMTTREGEIVTHSLKLVDLADGALHEVVLPPADQIQPLAYLPGQKKFLAARSEQQVDSVNRAECYLIDPQTGEATRIQSGEFRPWLQASTRLLQPADDGRYWAAIQNDLGTEVGLISEQTFQFEPVTHYPGVFFDSSQMWVSPPYLYVAIGDIVRLPFKP